MKGLLPRQRVAVALAVAFTVGTVGTALAAPQTAPGGNPNVTLDISPNDGANLPSPAAITVNGAGFGNSISGDLFQCTFDATNQVDICSNQPLGRFTSNSSGMFSSNVNVSSSFQGLNAQNQLVTVDCLVVNCSIQAVSDSGSFFSAHTISFAGGGTTTTSTTVPVTTTTSSTVPATTTTSSTVPVTTTTSSTVPVTTTTSSTVPATTTTSSTVPATTTTSSTVPATTTTVAPTTTIVVTTTTALPGDRCAQLRAARASFNSQLDRIAAELNNLPPDQRGPALQRVAAARAQGNAQFDQALNQANCNQG